MRLTPTLTSKHESRVFGLVEIYLMMIMEIYIGLITGAMWAKKIGIDVLPYSIIHDPVAFSGAMLQIKADDIFGSSGCWATNSSTRKGSSSRWDLYMGKSCIWISEIHKGDKNRKDSWQNLSFYNLNCKKQPISHFLVTCGFPLKYASVFLI